MDKILVDAFFDSKQKTIRKHKTLGVDKELVEELVFTDGYIYRIMKHASIVPSNWICSPMILMSVGNFLHLRKK